MNYKLKRDKKRGGRDMLKQYWLVTIKVNGFYTKMIVFGDESEMWHYMQNELGYIPQYRSIGDENSEMVDTARELGICIYLAPEIWE